MAVRRAKRGAIPAPLLTIISQTISRPWTAAGTSSVSDACLKNLVCTDTARHIDPFMHFDTHPPLKARFTFSNISSCEHEASLRFVARFLMAITTRLCSAERQGRLFRRCSPLAPALAHGPLGPEEAFPTANFAIAGLYAFPDTFCSVNDCSSVTLATMRLFSPHR